MTTRYDLTSSGGATDTAAHRATGTHRAGAAARRSPGLLPHGAARRSCCSSSSTPSRSSRASTTASPTLPATGPTSFVGLAELRRTVQRPSRAARLLVHVPDRRGGDHPGQHRLARDRRSASTADQVEDRAARRSTSSPTCSPSSSSATSSTTSSQNSLPCLGKKLGIDGCRRPCSPRRAPPGSPSSSWRSGRRRVQHHHLHRRPADRAGGPLRGRRASTAPPRGGSSAASRSR